MSSLKTSEKMLQSVKALSPIRNVEVKLIHLWSISGILILDESIMSVIFYGKIMSYFNFGFKKKKDK